MTSRRRRTRAPQRMTVGGISPESVVRLRPGRHRVEGKLRRVGTLWVLETPDGRLLVLSAVEEGQPGRLVNRTRSWVVRAGKRHRIAALAGDGCRRADIRVVPGGAYGQGKNRRH